jgi:RecB family exonuclease
MITWSHTKISDYLQCPHKFYEKHIRKSVKQRETEAMRTGTRVHKLLELAVNGNLQEFAVNGGKIIELEIERLAPIIPVIERLRSLGAVAELELGVRRDWTPCSFWDKDVWGRCKIDILAATPENKGLIIDWKTGKTKNIRYQTDAELRLHATIANAHFPELKVISGAYYYTQGFRFHPKPPERPYLFDALIAERYKINELMKRVEYAVENAQCGTRKNNLCPWCEVKTCKHYKPKEQNV